jgi:hypothetical protein
MLKHFAYAGGWKKFEPLWNFIIKSRQLNHMLPLLEAILSKVKKQPEPNRESAAVTAEPVITSVT